MTQYVHFAAVVLLAVSIGSLTVGAENPGKISQVRLVNGTTKNCGRLEVLYNGVWGTICDDTFDYAAAAVFCKMLGYTSGVSRYMGQAYGFGSESTQIWMDDVNCKGDESSINECQHSEFGTHNCLHSEDVSIYCHSEDVEIPRDALPMRLVPQPHKSHVKNEGRLEIYYNGTWGTVCDDEFGEIGANVACNGLGFDQIGVDVESVLPSDPLELELLENKTIWMDDVVCMGSEQSLLQCDHSEMGVSDCYHSEDVSIVCVTEAGRRAARRDDGPGVELRLVGGPITVEGRLEININGTWGTVCDDGFSKRAASLACSQMNLGSNGHALTNRYLSGKGPIWLDDVKCTGLENSITECRHSGVGKHNCGHDEDVSLYCARSCTHKTFLEVQRPIAKGFPMENATNIDQCQITCFRNERCFGYGWSDDLKGRTSRCYLGLKREHAAHDGAEDDDEERAEDDVKEESIINYGLTYFDRTCGMCPENSWNTIENFEKPEDVQLIQDGAVNQDDCRRACIMRPGCTGVEFNPIAPSGSQCLLADEEHGIVTSQVLSCRACRRYRLTRYHNWVAQGARLKAHAQSIDKCAKACLDNTGCNWFQFMPQNELGSQCWIAGEWVTIYHVINNETFTYGIDCAEKVNIIGCYAEKESDLEFKELKENEHKKMTLFVCSVDCRAQGKKYAAVRNGNICSCGDSYGKHGKSTDCHIPCTGDNKMNCGGQESNTVVHTGYSPEEAKQKGRRNLRTERNCTEVEKEICKNNAKCIPTLGGTSISCSCEGQWTGGDCSIPLPSSNVEEELFKSLLDEYKDYGALSRPRSVTRAVTFVRFATAILKVVEVDEKNEMLTLQVQYNLNWFDQRLAWSSSEFEGISRLNIPVEKIWTPEIHLENEALGEGERVGGSAEERTQKLVSVQKTGECNWRITAVITTHCSIDVKYFPFDLQKCQLEFRGFLPDEDVVLSTTGFSTNSAIRSNDDYKGDGQWDVRNVTMIRDPEDGTHATMTMFLERRSFYYVLNYVIPCFLFSIICLMTFLLPADSGERIGLGVTLLLAITVYQMIINDRLPETSESVPLLGVYFLFIMVVCAVSIGMFIVVTSMHSTTRKMPRWLKTGVDFLSKVLFMKLPICKKGKKTNEDEESEKDKQLTEVTSGNDVRKSSDAVVIKPPSIDDPLIEAIQNMQAAFLKLSDELREQRLKKEPESDEGGETEESQDWLRAAKVVDRICFLVFALSLVIGSLYCMLNSLVAKEEQLTKLYRESAESK